MKCSDGSVLMVTHSLGIGDADRTSSSFMFRSLLQRRCPTFNSIIPALLRTMLQTVSQIEYHSRQGVDTHSDDPEANSRLKGGMSVQTKLSSIVQKTTRFNSFKLPSRLALFETCQPARGRSGLQYPVTISVCIRQPMYTRCRVICQRKKSVIDDSDPLSEVARFSLSV